MKKFVTASTKIGMLVLISIAALAASAKAQTLGNGLRANIPFDFTVAGKKFAAGYYSITRATQTNGDLVLEVNSLDEHSRVLPITSRMETLTARDKSILIFHRYGDEYFLAEIWPVGSETGRELPKTRAERELARKAQDSGVAAINTPAVQTITLTVN